MRNVPGVRPRIEGVSRLSARVAPFSWRVSRPTFVLAGALAAVLVAAPVVAIAAVASTGPLIENPSAASRHVAGVEVVLRAIPGAGRRSVTAADLQRAASIVRNRLAKLGVRGGVTVKAGSKLIVVRLYGTGELIRSAALAIETPGQLMLFDFEKDLAPRSLDRGGNPVASTSLYALLKPVQGRAPHGPPERYYLFRKAGHRLLREARTLSDLLRPFGGKAPRSSDVLNVPAQTLVVRCVAATGCIGARADSRSGDYYYLLQFYPHGKGRGDPVPAMTGGDLVLSGTRADFGSSGAPVVLLQFTKRGSSVFRRITRAEAQRGQRNYNAAGRAGNYLNYVQHFAIVLDQQLESTPYIDFKRNPHGIAGLYVEIDLGVGGTFKEAKRLALVLQTGALPIAIVRVSQRAIP
jgi:preprotein translocase subunit SecD